MSAALSVVSQSPNPEVRELERDLARSNARLLALIGASQLAACANNDFRIEVRQMLEEGKLTLERFDQLVDLVDDELESLSNAGEEMLGEELRAVVP